jgi:helix-turn-helix protein
MTQLADQSRRFSVYARHADRHHAKVVEEQSFEAAAVAYVEDLPVIVDEDSDISVIVRDLGSGHEHCFRINLETGEAVPCG